MNFKSEVNFSMITAIAMIIIIIIAGFLILVFIEGNKEYYNKTMVVSEISIVDPVDFISNNPVNIWVVDTQGEGYLITKKFDVEMKVGEMYDIEYYVRNKQVPRIISKIKPDYYFETIDCEVVGSVC